jgi:hypothetical protein
MSMKMTRTKYNAIKGGFASMLREGGWTPLDVNEDDEQALRWQRTLVLMKE